jgi:hypothetical protein
MILTKLWLRSASTTRTMHALFFVRGVEERSIIFPVAFKRVLSTMCVIDEYFILVPLVVMLHLSLVMILESIADVSREHCDSLLRSRLFGSVLFETDPLKGKGDGVAMLLLKYRLAHAAARAAVVGTLPGPTTARISSCCAGIIHSGQLPPFCWPRQ